MPDAVAAAEFLGPMRARTGAGPAQRVLLVAQGAGAGRDHEFFTDLLAALAAVDVLGVALEFSTWQAMARVPPAVKAQAELAQAMRDARQRWPGAAIALGGKSFGGRMASHIVDATDAIALVCLGFPLHLPKAPAAVRGAHLATVTTPSVFISGDRDAMADLSLLGPLVTQMPRGRLVVVRGADHGFAVRKKDGRTHHEVMRELAISCRSEFAKSSLTS